MQGGKPLMVRRVVMVAIVLAVAAGLALYYGPREKHKAQEVQQFLTSVCQDVATGRDPAPRLAGTDPVTAKYFVLRLKSIFESIPGAIDGLAIEVRPGDAPDMPGGRATHSASIRIGDSPVLDVRISYDERASRMTIIGFNTPP